MNEQRREQRPGGGVRSSERKLKKADLEGWSDGTSQSLAFSLTHA